jgi:hypothetical protein
MHTVGPGDDDDGPGFAAGLRAPTGADAGNRVCSRHGGRAERREGAPGVEYVLPIGSEASTE